MISVFPDQALKIPILGRTKEQVDFCPPRESFQGIRANGLAGIAQLVEQRIRNAKVVGSTLLPAPEFQEKAAARLLFVCGSGTAASAHPRRHPPKGCHRSAALPFPNAATMQPPRCRELGHDPAHLLDSIPPHTAHAHPARRRRHHDRRKRARLPARRTLRGRLGQDGNAADLALRTGPYDLILLDLGLPRRDGLTLLRELRAAGPHAGPDRHRPRRRQRPHRGTGRGRGRLHRQTL